MEDSIRSGGGLRIGERAGVEKSPRSRPVLPTTDPPPGHRLFMAECGKRRILSCVLPEPKAYYFAEKLDNT